MKQMRERRRRDISSPNRSNSKPGTRVLNASSLLGQRGVSA